MTNANQHVVFGTGPLGLAVMDVLVAQGKEVTLVNRSGTIGEATARGVNVVRADVTVPQEVTAVSRNAAVVYLCAMPPYTQWPTLFPPLVNGVLAGVAATNATLVYGDNLYMYGPNPNGGRISEDLPDAATGHKGRTRAAMAQTLLDAHAAGKLRVAIGRAPDFYGPRALNATFGERFWQSVLAGKTPNLIGDLDQPHTYTFIRDFARGLVTLGAHEAALGQAWHVPSAPTITTRQWLALVETELGTTIKPRVANKAMLTMLGWFNPLIREIKEMYPSFANPYIVDHSRFAATFGGEPTSHQTAIRETLAWFQQRTASSHSVSVGQH